MLYGPVDKHAHRRGDQKIKGQQQHTQLARGADDHRGQPQHGAEGVEDRHGLLLAQTVVNQPVVEMPPVGGHGVLAPEQAADDGKGRVEQRKRQGEDGHDEGDDRVEFEQPQNGNGGKYIAQQQRSGVAHENLRGVHIVGDEAQTAPGQGSQQQRHVGLRHHQRRYEHRHGGNRGNAAGQPVQPVDEVHGVGNAHDPEQGNRDAQHSDGNQRFVGGEHVGVHQALDDHAVDDRHHGGDHLGAELDKPAQLYNVIHDPRGDDDDRANEDALHLGVNADEEQHTDEKAEENRHAAHAGDGMVVNPALAVGHVDRAHPCGEVLDNGRRAKGHGGGGRHGQQDLEP